jgi:hypothetical protein
MSITSGYSHWRVASLPRSSKKSGMKYWIQSPELSQVVHFLSKPSWTLYFQC